MNGAPAEDKDSIEGYPLSRDFVDFNRYGQGILQIWDNPVNLYERLNLQHYLWREVFGYLLHPKIQHSRPSLKIADIGTGTAVWLLDLCKEAGPEVQLDAIDIDASQTTPQPWLPQNINLIEWDVMGEVPTELVGQYDVLHLRLFLFVVKGDPRHVLRNLMKLLKPGGWLQWAESDSETFTIQKTDQSKSSVALENLYKTAGSMDPRLLPTWVKDLPKYFEEEGFVNVEYESKYAEPHIAFALHECNLALYDMFVQKTPDRQKAEKVSRLISEAAVESKNGAMIAFRRIHTIGMKQLDG